MDAYVGTQVKNKESSNIMAHWKEPNRTWRIAQLFDHKWANTNEAEYLVDYNALWAN